MTEVQWKGRNVLVTGAGGFIGSHLVEELLTRGAKVTALVRYNSRNSWGWLDGRYRASQPNLSVMLGDVTDAQLVHAAVTGKQTVFHLAALIGIPYSYAAPSSYVQTNVIGTLNVLQACREMGVDRMVHTSTSEVYGSAQYTPIDERHPLVGQSPYSASKIGADKLAESFHRSFDLPVVILRPFNTYGPRQSARAVIPAIITQALTSDTVRLGTLDPVRDFTFVADSVDGFIRAAESEEAVGRTVHTGSGRGVTIGALAVMILQQTNPRAKIVTESGRVRPEMSEVQQLICNNALAKSVLAWEPRVTLEAGIAKTVAWVREHLDVYKASAYAV
ncbi:MAG: SDR family NAD(P)-dependent oxidoreductase [Methanomicrobiales archaeon]|nr:SDR family NAD(P)-dependent oxidoreductase [Methanomicrobiales archaeon]